MLEACNLDLWDRHYRAELPDAGDFCLTFGKKKSPFRGFMRYDHYVAKDIINHPLTSVKWFNDESPAIT
jgi:hypothetical protein